MFYLKKIFYISAFTFLGALLSTLLHAFIEIFYIRLLTSDFDRFSLGFDWNEWYTVHAWFSAILLFAGLVFGFFQGRYWWQYIYVDKRLKRIL